MESEESKTCTDEEFAEKCRKALENDLGFALPVPKLKSQKTDATEQNKTPNVELADEQNKENGQSYDRSIDVSTFSKDLEAFSSEFDKDTLETLDKIKKQQRLSTEEFQKFFDVIWKKGPDSRATNPNAWFNEAEF